ncbi:MAG: L,D-transpeptidase family protein [Magnetococcales bacterium]|nr:L,D-transpeptidase family protein [Magnetococcales bacterium]
MLVLVKEEGEEPVIRLRADVESQVRSLLRAVGLGYPLQRGIVLLVFKEEKRLEVWANTENAPRFVTDYPALAMSGHAGPKQRRGDHQVPEGIYRIVWLNPNSAFHLSLKLDYPNTFDLQRAEEESRTDLGGDIFIHGGAASVGCVAIGDGAIEELFVMNLMAGDGPTEVIIAPYDFRQRPLQEPSSTQPVWLSRLYQEIAARLAGYRLPVASD